MKTTFDFEFGLTSDHLDGKPISVRPIIDLLMSDMYHDPVEDTTDDRLEVCYCGLCQEIQPALIQVEDYIAALRDQLARAQEVMKTLQDGYAELVLDVAALLVHQESEYKVAQRWFGGQPGESRPEKELQAAAAWLEEEDGERNE